MLSSNYCKTSTLSICLIRQQTRFYSPPLIQSIFTRYSTPDKFIRTCSSCIAKLLFKRTCSIRICTLVTLGKRLLSNLSLRKVSKEVMTRTFQSPNCRETGNMCPTIYAQMTNGETTVESQRRSWTIWVTLEVSQRSFRSQDSLSQLPLLCGP